MRDRTYIFLFLLVAGLLVFVGRSELPPQTVLTATMTFGGTTAIAVLMISLFRVRGQLAASRHELARKDAELSFAHEVQRSLFPRDVPKGAGLEFSAICIPAQGISGDYYDIIQTSDGRIYFAIADISGKGISAAILMANLQALLRMTVTRSLPLTEALEALNRHFYQVTESNKFATFFVGEWDSALRRLYYVNAGHQIPIVKGSTAESRLTKGGPPVGLFADIRYEMGEVDLKPSELLVLYSDGVSEASSHGGVEFGVTRLGELIDQQRDESIQQVQQAILDAIGKWTGRSQPEDDLTILLVRALPPTSEGEVE